MNTLDDWKKTRKNVELRTVKNYAFQPYVQGEISN